MPLGIKPTVDFAFKKIFGSPENVAALIGLLNAILDLGKPVVSVNILNPFSYQEFANAKQIVLDVRCQDAAGRYFNVEMQIAVYGGLVERLVYYACSMHCDQLSKGDSYASLSPSVSICLLRQDLFTDTLQAHHRFELLDQESRRKLENAIEVHTIELAKYNLDEVTISEASKLEQWAFLLLRAQDYEAAMLKRLLPGIEFETAIETLQIISAKTEDKQMYDQREKAQKDYEWALSGAREQGREEGREEGRVAGQVQLLQELLGESQTPDSELQRLDASVIASLLAELQQRLRNRQS